MCSAGFGDHICNHADAGLILQAVVLKLSRVLWNLLHIQGKISIAPVFCPLSHAPGAIVFSHYRKQHDCRGAVGYPWKSRCNWLWNSESWNLSLTVSENASSPVRLDQRRSAFKVSVANAGLHRECCTENFTWKVWSFAKPGRGVTPNQTLFLKNKGFSGTTAHRTILGHPKHVLHLVSSPSAIAKALM